jgi:Fe(3+) dicitrate transport protein
VGSFGLFSSFNSLGGQVGKLNYYVFVQHKQGDGWRENSAFNQNTAYLGLQLAATEKLRLGFQYTYMHYLAQQPGGLTDSLFAVNARASYRDRNWFAANWNLPALTLDYQFSPHTRLNARAFALLADRSSLGNLSPPSPTDVAPETPRDYQRDDYRNGGVELRLLREYHLPIRQHQAAEQGHLLSSLLVGMRLYHGNTHRRQGLGPGGTDADFQYLHPDNLEQSDFRFPSDNVAVFAENLFRLSSRLTLTPGVRYEYLRTTANGYYYQQDQTGPTGARLTDDRSRARSFVLLGLGAGFDLTPLTNLYANFSQNYSPVNYNDVRTVNPNLRVDPNIQDVRGYNADLGYRGSVGRWLSFDASVFYLSYKNRIGTDFRRFADGQTGQYRTNIADSRSLGVEAFAEADALALLRPNTRHHLSAFASVAYTDARYLKATNYSIEGNFVELAPQWVSRGGISYRGPQLSATVQAAYTTEQFTDAGNTRYNPDPYLSKINNGLIGEIPAYTVVDASASYTWHWLMASGGVGNLLDKRYFTRRAAGYPGPGILPSDGRNYYLTLGAKI